MSTNAPNLVTLVTDPFERHARLAGRAISFTPSLNLGATNLSRGSRPGFLSSSIMSFSV